MHKVDGSKMVTLSTSPLLLGYELYKMVSKIQIEASAAFLMIFGAHNMKISFIIKVKIVVPVLWSCRSPLPQNVDYEFRMIITCSKCIPIPFKHMSFLYLFLKPQQSTITLKCRCSIRKSNLKRLSTYILQNYLSMNA